MSPLITSRRSFHFLALFSFISLLSRASSDELHTLLTIKAALQTTNNVFDSWQTTNSVCNFTGITCHPDRSVQGIELSNQGLAGTVPFDSICQLKSLEKLSLGRNSLHGIVSDDLRNCVKLKYLDIGNNLFSGPVPDISPLNGLNYLYMNSSGFSGVFPWNSLTNMTGLIDLSVGDNPFDRTPFPDVVAELNQLNWLYLTNCSIEGRIPWKIGNLKELVNLELSDNYLSGEIPAEISKLSKLRMLELYNNDFTGKFPPGLGNLTKLQLFDASQNRLEGDLSELKSMTELVTLQLFENQFSGEVPAEFGDFKKLVNLSLYTNNFIGSLPERLGSWAEFDYIDVSENNLTGPIPPGMCKRGTMKELLMLQNRFTGEIPATYGNCTSLTRFRVSNNLLSGVVPSQLWALPNVGLIDIAFNKFEGPITSDIGKAKSLAQLVVNNNRLSGELPPEISGAKSLSEIDLSYNLFSGRVPAEIGQLKELYKVHLQSNNFSGPIPDSVGSCRALADLSMAENSLSGEIPASIGSLPSLNAFNLSRNELSGQIPPSLSSLRLSLLDLSYNRLTGPIPRSLSFQANNGSFAGNSGLCSENIKNFRRCSSGSGSSHENWIIVLGVAVGAVVLLLSVSCFLYMKKSQQDRERSFKDDSWDMKSFHVLTFTEDEVLDSIKKENVIGKGGSGDVYKVVLPNGTELAVKHIWTSDSCGRKVGSAKPMLSKGARKCREFDAEVETLSSIRHVNVVKLYCSITSDDSSFLVYEYLPNGSLWDQLHVNRKLAMDWETRYEIALGAAKGLEYLHLGCDRPVIHRDVKSSNILLDEEMKPRIADFGLARIVRANAIKDSTQVIAGTPGYIAPEYGYARKVNEKCDVYSFGVVLMELVTGKRPIEAEYGEHNDIVHWVSSKLKSRESVLGLVDSQIPAAYREDAIKMLRIAILCTDRLPAHRPTMRSVVQMLEEAAPPPVNWWASSSAKMALPTKIPQSLEMLTLINRD